MTSTFSIRSNWGALTRVSNQINAVVNAELGEGAPAGLELAGELIVGKVQALSSRPFPPASSPGKPPHLRTGELSDGYGFTVDGKSLGITNSAKHFVFVEFGTSRMAPRPALRPAMRESRDQITAAISRAMDRAGRAAAR